MVNIGIALAFRHHQLIHLQDRSITGTNHEIIPAPIRQVQRIRIEFAVVFQMNIFVDLITLCVQL